MTPFFSIIIPTYNRGQIISRAIDSVLSQSYENFELLIMDDGSIDNTKEVVGLFQDKRIIYEWDHNSGGPARPRNRGIIKAKGEWICFLDSDDLWYSNKLDVLKRLINNDLEIDAICHNEIMRYVENNKTLILKYGPFKKDFYKYLLMNGNCISTSAIAIAKNFLNKNNLFFNESKEFRIVEDYDLWLRMAMCDCQFLFHEEILGEYLIDESNISHEVYSAQINLENLYRYHAYSHQNFEGNKTKLWKKLVTSFYIKQAISFLIRKKYELAYNSIKNAFIKSFIYTIFSLIRLDKIARNYFSK